MKQHFMLTAAVIGLGASVAMAQSQSGSASGGGAPSAEEFVKKATMSDMFEIRSGELASEKAESPEVQSFGKHLVDDHTKSSNELMAAAESAGIVAEAPKSLDDRHQAMLDQLQQASGEEFDRLFAEMQVKAHEDGVALFSSYAEGGDEAPLTDFASKTLPVLTEHLETAETLHEK